MPSLKILPFIGLSLTLAFSNATVSHAGEGETLEKVKDSLEALKLAVATARAHLDNPTALEANNLLLRSLARLGVLVRTIQEERQTVMIMVVPTDAQPKELRSKHRDCFIATIQCAEQVLQTLEGTRS